jgi:uncharacterized protein YvpB
LVKKLSLFLLVSGLGLTAAAQSLQEDLPDYAFVTGIVAHGQTYPLSCESRSAADLANYWGIPVDEVEFFDSLPLSDDPEKGFVGSVRGVWGHVPPNSYGVHAVPVASLLRQYGLDAKAQRGMSLYELKGEIANGRPVIVWVVGHVWRGSPETYTTKDGRQVTVARFEHTMLAYGYDKAGVYLIDAGNGTRGNYDYERFNDSWEVLGNMAVTASGTIHNKLDEYDCVIYDEDSGGYFDILIPWTGGGWQKSLRVKYHCPI